MFTLCSCTAIALLAHLCEGVRSDSGESDVRSSRGAKSVSGVWSARGVRSDRGRRGASGARSAV